MKLEVNRNILDRTIGYFSPQAELNRVKSRARLQILSRAFDGASISRRTANWTTSGSDANSEIASGIAYLRSRSRDLVRNNPYAKRAVGSIQTNVIGAGIIPQTLLPRSSREYDTYEKLWIDWGDTVACHNEERLDFYGLQSLAMRTIAESGSVLIRRRRRRLSDNLPIPLQIQLMEPDHLDTTRDSLYPDKDGHSIIQGVEYDRRGRRVAYWLYQEHPGSGLAWKSIQSVRVPASEILHIFRTERCGQADGIPWGAPCIIRLRDLDEFEDAHLMRQKIAACFTAFVHDSDLEDISANTAEAARQERVEPGMIEYLSPGKSVTFGSPPPVVGYKEHTTVTLQSIAAGYEVTYECLTGDYSQVNFSSGRMGWIEFHRNITQWQDHMIIPGLCKGVWQWFMQSALMAGKVDAPAQARWTAPRREMLDPFKETEAIKRGIRNGLISPQEAVRMTGRDVDDVLGEYREWNKKIDEYDLKFDSDPRWRTVAGIYTADNSIEQNSGDPTE